MLSKKSPVLAIQLLLHWGKSDLRMNLHYGIVNDLEIRTT